MTQFKPLFFCILIGLIGLSSFGVNAQQNETNNEQNGVNAQQNQIYVITTFDYPGVGNSITPFAINERGDIVGDNVDSAGVRRGFRRRVNGSFTSIVAPGDTGNFTRARGINNSRTITGDFFTLATNTYHGYFLNGTTYTQYDFGGPFSTAVYGINDAGDFVGVFGSLVQPNRAFVKIGGTATTIIIPGAYDSYGYDINSSNRAVGSYRDLALVDHGFIRSSNGTLTNPVDFPGSASTSLNGINGQGRIVGSYTDALGRQHGLFRKNANKYVSFDYPGAVSTSLNGINDFGFIVGRYTDAAGIRHGFLACVRGGEDGDDDHD